MRARFVVVPLVVVGLPTAYLAAVSVSEWLDDNADKRAERSYERQVRPALDALRGIRLDGFADCSRDDTICRRAEKADIGRTNDALGEALRDVGATDVASRCQTICTVTARLRGTDVHGLVGRTFVGQEPTGGVEVTLTVTP